MRHFPAPSSVFAVLFLAVALPAAAQPAPTSPAQTMTLDEALQYALEHYPAVRRAIEQANASQAEVAAAQATSWPRLDAVWQTNRGTANNIFGQVFPQSIVPAMSGPVLESASASSAWGTAAGALFTWEALDFGLRDAGVAEAQAGVGRAQADEAATRLAVQRAVGASFLDVVSAERAVAAVESDVQRRDVLARSAHVLADNQLRPGAEASRADAERAAALTRAIQARQALAIARAHLARSLGLTPGSIAVNASALLAAVPTGSPPTAPSPPPSSHPDVRASQAVADLSRARESVLSKTDRPRLLVQSALFARGSGANPDGHFDGGASGLWFDRANWAVGVQLLFPNLFDFSSLRARRAAAEAQSRTADARREEAILAVTAERQTADAIAESAVAIAQNTPVQLAAARLSETQARARYDAGLASIVEVVETQSLLATAEFQDALARVDVWRALLAQASAMGDLTPFIERARAAGVP